MSPSYLTDMLVLFGRQVCSSYYADTLKFHGHEVQVGNQAFSVAGPAACNNLSIHVQTSETLTVLQSHLKTHLVTVSYL